MREHAALATHHALLTTRHAPRRPHARPVCRFAGAAAVARRYRQDDPRPCGWGSRTQGDRPGEITGHCRRRPAGRWPAATPAEFSALEAARIRLVGDGITAAAALDPGDPAGALLLAEAVSLAAKVMDDGYFLLKPRCVAEAFRLGGAGGWGEDGCFYLFHEEVGVACFHDPAGEMYHLVELTIDNGQLTHRLLFYAPAGDRSPRSGWAAARAHRPGAVCPSARRGAAADPAGRG